MDIEIGAIIVLLIILLINIWDFKNPDRAALFGIRWLFKDKEVSDNIKTTYKIRSMIMIIFCAIFIIWFLFS